MKGQFFIVGAIIVSVLLAHVVLSQPPVQEEYTKQGKYLFENVKDESENTVSIILVENRTTENVVDRMRSYMGFLDKYAIGHNANITSYFLIGLQRDQLNITVGNYRGLDINTIGINISGDVRTLSNMKDHSMNTISFPLITNRSLLTYNFTFNNSIENGSFNISNRPFTVFNLRLEKDREVWINTITVN